MPILIKGEKLAQKIKRTNTGGPKKYPYTIEQATERMLNDVNKIQKELKTNSEKYLDNEIFICVRMADGFLAKSYKPEKLFHKKESMEFVGARTYRTDLDDIEDEKKKLYFVKGNKENIHKLMNDLKESNFNKTEEKQLRSIYKLDLLEPNEKAQGFYEENKEYEVEIVLHPINQDLDCAINKLKILLMNEPEIRSYVEGPTFILGKIKKENVPKLTEYNFLRTIHPMREVEVPSLTRSSKVTMPELEIGEHTGDIRIGVFDGGVSIKNKYLSRFVSEYNLSSLPKNEEYIRHGNAVCGAVLYGELNKYKTTDILPIPKVIVDSFRVLPETNLYKVIDNIEMTVKTRTDIDIFNISFGPRGPILDDQINRFTYTLDKLALQNKIFCVAVGNDGDVVEPFNRIQAPADLVNGIGVGAYSYYKSDLYRASYSCIGTGREGGKVKPDILAFGGDERTQFQAIDLNGDYRATTAGTSFASPVVAGKLGQLVGISSQISGLMARTLLIQTASGSLDSSIEEGFGVIEDKLVNIINCNDRKVTVLYEGSMFATDCIKLPIPLPDVTGEKGVVKFNWTITTLSDVDPLDSDIYTNCCIEETFYPNSNVFTFFKKGKNKRVKKHIIKHKEHIKELMNEGYQRSALPASATGKNKTEYERRLDMKWDTISRKFNNKNVGGVEDPFLILQAIGRSDKKIEKVKFCVAVTIEIGKYSRNLYNSILERYNVLLPIDVEVELEDDIRVI